MKSMYRAQLFLILLMLSGSSTGFLSALGSDDEIVEESSPSKVKNSFLGGLTNWMSSFGGDSIDDDVPNPSFATLVEAHEKNKDKEKEINLTIATLNDVSGTLTNIDEEEKGKEKQIIERSLNGPMTPSSSTEYVVDPRIDLNISSKFKLYMQNNSGMVENMLQGMDPEQARKTIAMLQSTLEQGVLMGTNQDNKLMIEGAHADDGFKKDMIHRLQMLEAKTLSGWFVGMLQSMLTPEKFTNFANKLFGFVPYTKDSAVNTALFVAVLEAFGYFNLGPLNKTLFAPRWMMRFSLMLKAIQSGNEVAGTINERSMPYVESSRNIMQRMFSRYGFDFTDKDKMYEFAALVGIIISMYETKRRGYLRMPRAFSS